MKQSPMFPNLHRYLHSFTLLENMYNIINSFQA
jgi:hypothetical protein